MDQVEIQTLQQVLATFIMLSLLGARILYGSSTARRSVVAGSTERPAEELVLAKRTSTVPEAAKLAQESGIYAVGVGLGTTRFSTQPVPTVPALATHFASPSPSSCAISRHRRRVLPWTRRASGRVFICS